MEKNDKDPDDHHDDDHNDKSSGEEKGDVVSDAHPPDDTHHDQDGISKDNVDETDQDPGDKVDSPKGQEAPEIHQTLESLSEELDQLLSSLSLHQEEQHKGDSTKEKQQEGEEDYFQIPQFVGKFLDLFEDKLTKHDSGGEPKTTTWHQDPEEVSSLLDAVDRVSKLMKLLLNTKSCLDHHEPLINHAGSIQQRAMAFLEEQFRILLEESVIKEPAHVITDDQQDHNNDDTQDQDQTMATESGDQEIEYPGYSEETVTLLKNIAEMMKGGGYLWECREVYLVARRNILMLTLKQDCEFEKVSIEEVLKMSWGELEREIPIWNKTFKNCSSLYFPGELKLAEKIFPQEGSLFCIVTHGLAIQFLGFYEAVAMTKRSTEKLFKILDIYETLRDSFPAMEKLFPEELRSELRNEVASARSRLGETAINIFLDLENSIKSDSSKTPVPGGAVHPLTRYTMNYLKYACEYKDTLEQVFKSHSTTEQEGEDVEEKKKEENSPFANQLMRIMDFLDGNMEGKSKLYKDIPLSSIFMMNNGRYIVQKIKGSAEIHEVMGDTWCRKRSSELRNYHKNYQRETWGKLLGFLGHEGLMHNGKIVKPNLKERFKSFNATFDEIHKTQTTWVVNDEQLQSELRVSITAVMIPAYRAFMARFGQYLDPGRQTEKYVKYQPEDIEDLIDELFEGNTSSSSAATAKRRT
ncbi:hypothetical protein HA466_0315480 [Hirschfeldia incana]|nr:hypothetical protein HA466_0315480 [Hirschfeldia incana]